MTKEITNFEVLVHPGYWILGDEGKTTEKPVHYSPDKRKYGAILQDYENRINKAGKGNRGETMMVIVWPFDNDILENLENPKNREIKEKLVRIRETARKRFGRNLVEFFLSDASMTFAARNRLLAGEIMHKVNERIEKNNQRLGKQVSITAYGEYMGLTLGNEITRRIRYRCVQSFTRHLKAGLEQKGAKVDGISFPKTGVESSTASADERKIKRITIKDIAHSIQQRIERQKSRHRK